MIANQTIPAVEPNPMISLLERAQQSSQAHPLPPIVSTRHELAFEWLQRMRQQSAVAEDLTGISSQPGFPFSQGLPSVVFDHNCWGKIQITPIGLLFSYRLFGSSCSKVECRQQSYPDGSVKVTIVSHPAESSYAASSGERERAQDNASDFQDSMDWINKHRSEYVGQWVALDGDRLIGHGFGPDEILKAISASGVSVPFITQIESEENPLFVGW